MMKKTMLVIALLGLAGCDMLNTRPTADNREWIEVSCSGFADWTKCNEKAARMCPSGYDVAGREESVIAQRRIMKFACTK
jgi:hypothetical protein